MTESFGETLTRLSSAQKGRARGAPAYSVYVNRPVGRVFAAIAFRAGASPNHVTIVSAVFTFTAITLLMLVPVQPWLGIVVWLLLAIGYALDSADGQVARLRGGGSLSGEWLDHFVDANKAIALHLAVAVGFFRYYALPPAILLVTLGFALVAGVPFFGMILNDLLKAKKGLPTAVKAGGFAPWRSVVLLPTDYGFLCLVFSLWGVPALFLPVYSLVFAACAAFLVTAAIKWFRDMVRLDRTLAG
jgi:phosphatidylglycerophosphate synthase